MSMSTFAAGRDPVRIAFEPRHAAGGGRERGRGIPHGVRRAHARAPGHHPGGSDPVGLAIEPDGSHAYVASTREDEVTVIDLATNIVSGTSRSGASRPGLAWVDVHR